jgi:glucan biosynthesis protein C
MSPTTPSSERLHGLDALRGLALLLGVVLHAGLAYLPTPIWPAADDQTSPAVAVIFFAIHLFRMTTFFLIAGLFAQMMLDRRGWAGFLRDRIKRIALPLVVFWCVVFPAFIAALLWSVWVSNGGAFPTDGPPPPPMTLETFPLLHLWFLWVLLIFYAVMLVARVALAPFKGIVAGDRLGLALVGPWTPFVLAAPLAVSLYLTPDWIPFFGIPTPDTGLLPNPAALVAFGVAFTFGAMVASRLDLLKRIERLWPVFTVLALGTGAGALMLSGGANPEITPMTDPASKAEAAALYALAAYAGAFAVTALALRFASGASATRRYLADASYWIYVVHLPLVLAGQTLMLNVAAPWWVKLSVVSIGTLLIALATYALMVRHTFIGSWLNGRKRPRRLPVNAAAQPAE